MLFAFNNKEVFAVVLDLLDKYMESLVGSHENGALIASTNLLSQ